jgi:hypothetical protein
MKEEHPVAMRGPAAGWEDSRSCNIAALSECIL